MRTTRRSTTLVVITAIATLALVIGSFVVGNFGLSVGMIRTPIVGDNFFSGHPLDYSYNFEWNPASGDLSISGNYSIAHVVIWLSLLVVLYCLWDTARDGIRLGIEPQQERVEEMPERRRFTRLKNPPVPQQPKRHPSYRLT
jgi:hypothetical protein